MQRIATPYALTLKNLFLLCVSLTAMSMGTVKGQQPTVTPTPVSKPDSTPGYITSHTGFVMVLRQGQDVLSSVKWLARKESIKGASFNAFGFVEAEFGYFNNQTKKYDPKKVKGELASLTGSIAWNADTVSLHTHAVVTDSTFQGFGGHLLSAVVGTGSVEIFITPTGQPLGRKVEQPLDANVLQLKKD